MKIAKLGWGIQLAKVDIKRLECSDDKCIRWKGALFVDSALPFGLISPKNIHGLPIVCQSLCYTHDSLILGCYRDLESLYSWKATPCTQVLQSEMLLRRNIWAVNKKGKEQEVVHAEQQWIPVRLYVVNINCTYTKGQKCHSHSCWLLLSLHVKLPLWKVMKLLEWMTTLWPPNWEQFQLTNRRLLTFT